MADRNNRRKPGMTVGQRMRDFSRSVMRHYAPLPDDLPTASSSVSLPASPAPSSPPLVESPEANPQFVASPPLPFDTPAADSPAPLLPPVDVPVYAPDPPLPQYVVPSTPPAPVVQRTEQPARPASNIAMGPDGKPLMYNGKPVPVDSDPTPPALLELMQRQRLRDAEVQRLKEERTEQLKAELPPQPEDGDAPRSSRIRRRGSADVDYIQTKALADKREPGDTAADPKPNVKSPREPEKQEMQSLDDDDDSSGASIDSPPFEAPTDTASPVTDPSGISTASDAPAIQRDFDAETPVTSIPFDKPIDVPLAEPAIIPDVSELDQPYAAPELPVANDAPPITVQRQPDTEAFSPSQTLDSVAREPSASRPADPLLSQAAPSPADAPQASTLPVQRQADAEASASQLPLTESNLTRHDGRSTEPTSASDVPQTLQAITTQSLPLTAQREAAPEIAPSLPFDAPADQPGLVDEPQVPVIPATEIPSVQREFKREVPAPTLPFDVPPAFDAPEIFQPQIPNTPEAASETVVAATPAAVQREIEPGPSPSDLSFPSQPVEQASVGDAHPPQVTVKPDVTQASAAPLAPVVQRQADSAPSDPSLPFDEPIVSDAVVPQPEQTVSNDASPFQQSAARSDAPSPALQRQADVPSLPFDEPVINDAVMPQPEQTVSNDASPFQQPAARPDAPSPALQRQADVPSLPFDEPVISEAVVADVSPLQQPVMPEAAQSIADAVPSAPAASVQREPEVATSVPFDAQQAEQPAALDRSQAASNLALPTPESGDTTTAKPSLTVQRSTATEAPVPSLPFDATSALADAPVVSPQLPSASVDVSAQSPVPAVQRQVETDLPVPSIPFDEAPEQAVSDRRHQFNAADSAPASPEAPQPSAAAIQRQPETDSRVPISRDVPTVSREMSDTPQLGTTAVAPNPTIQRHVEPEPAAQPIPFDATQPDPNVAQETSPREPSITAVQRQFEAAASAPDAPLSIEQVAEPVVSQPLSDQARQSPSIQREADTEVPSMLPFDTAVQDARLPVDTAVQPFTPNNRPQTDIAALPVQRQANEDAASPIPFEAADEAQRSNVPQTKRSEAQPAITPDISRPEVASVPQPAAEMASDSTAAPAIQRYPEAETTASPLPFDQPQAMEEVIGSHVDQPVMPDVPDAVQLSAAAIPADAPVNAATAIQREVEAGSTPSPLPFDVPSSVLSAAPQVLQSEAPDSSERAPAGIAQTAAAAPAAPQTLQRQVLDNPPLPFDTPAAATVDVPSYESDPGQSAVSDISPISESALPTAAMPPGVQRQADASMPVSAPEIQTAASAALPFDDLDASAVQRMPLEQRAPTAPLASLPFDPIASHESGDIQRVLEPASADPFSMPGNMPMGASAESRMDVFQALVAAGMVSRPPGGNAMPEAAVHTPSLLQRSPSREAYLANMAQRQENSGAVSGPIQRALSEESAPEVPTQSTSEDEAPEIDINQLASDVMRVLRGKLRSEHERLSKR